MLSSTDYDSLVRSVRPQLVRYAGRLVGETDAEDVVQLVLAKAASALATFRGEASPRTWLFRIATNSAHDWNRARRGIVKETLESVSAEQDGALGVDDASQERRLVREEMSQCVGAVLGRLPESYQVVLALSDCEELSDREVAEVLGLTVGAAKIRLHRARAKMKEELESSCSFYHDAENVLCCDKKQKSTANAYHCVRETRQQDQSRSPDGKSENPNEEPTMSIVESLPIKQQHLIGVGAAMAAGCQPCTTSYVTAAKTEGACERGVRFAIEQGLKGRQTATTAMSEFASGAFAQPELEENFRAERALLGALIEVAAAVAGNAASSLKSRIDQARSLGATDGQLRTAVRIAEKAKRGAENAMATVLATVLGDMTDAAGTPCCAERSADAATGPCACGSQS
jgi:RNA polymerase sigma-70 factor, ECF subfamily